MTVSPLQRKILLVISIILGIYLLVMQNHPVGWVLLLCAAGLIYYQIRHNPAKFALVKLAEGDIEAAEELLQQMGNPNSLPADKQATYYLATGWIELKTGNLKVCQEHVLKALDVGLQSSNDQACANLLLAKVHASQGASQQAQQHLTEAKELEHNNLLAAEIAQFETEITIAIQYDLTIQAESIHSRFEKERTMLIKAAHAQKEALETEYNALMTQLKTELEEKLITAREEKEAELAAALEKRNNELAKLEEEQQYQDQKQIEQIINLDLNENETMTHIFENAKHASQVATEMFAQTLKRLDNDEMASYLKLQVHVERDFQILLEKIQQNITQQLEQDVPSRLVNQLRAEYEPELTQLQQLVLLNSTTGSMIKYPTSTHQLIYDVFQLFRAVKLRVRNSKIKPASDPPS